MNNNLTGARCIVYSIIRRYGGVLSHNQLLQKTAYRKRQTVMEAVNYLVEHGYIDRTGTGNGTPYSYAVKEKQNVLDT